MISVPQYFIKEFNGSTTIVLAVVTEADGLVAASVSLVYSDYYKLQHYTGSERLGEWSIAKVDWETDKTCQLPHDTILPLKGFGIGSLLRNLVIEQARYKFAGYKLKSASLSEVDDFVDSPLTPTPARMSVKEGVKNATRRHHFYENAGFELEYSEPGFVEGYVTCDDIGQLRVSNSSEEPFQQVDLSHFIDNLRSANRDLTSKNQYAYEKLEKHLNALNKFKRRYRQHLYASMGVVGFLLFCLYALSVTTS